MNDVEKIIIAIGWQFGLSAVFRYNKHGSGYSFHLDLLFLHIAIHPFGKHDWFMFHNAFLD